MLAYLLAWFGLLIIAVINAAFRDKVYGPMMSELAAHQISCVSGIILFAVFIWFFTGWFSIGSQGEAALIGGMWLAMTLAFEFGYFHYVGGKPWSQLRGATSSARRGQSRFSLFRAWRSSSPATFLVASGLAERHSATCDLTPPVQPLIPYPPKHPRPHR